MKKNITINLCGRLFQIDEDAYEMLQHYTDSLRSYFGKQEGGEEIADDIEARIAELLDELKQQGNEAVTIDHVRDIISRIGKPEQLAGDNDGTSSQQPAGESILDGFRSRMSGRRLVVYVILAFVLPEAKTPEELLQMEGKEVTPQNLASMVTSDTDEKPRPNILRAICSIILKIGFGIVVFFLALSCLAMIAGLIFLVVAIVSALVLPLSADMPFSLEAMGLA